MHFYFCLILINSYNINSQDPYIQFTTEDPKEDESIPFLDTLLSWGPNNTPTTTVYHKPTHTDQYLHWNSNHFLTAKYSKYKSLTHRARVVCTSQLAFHQEESHIRQVLLKCNFSLNNLHTKFHHRLHADHTQHNNSATINSRNLFLVVPYSQGVSERFSKPAGV